VKAGLLLAVALALPACALLRKSEPQVPRYFTPGYDGDVAAAPARSGLQLRLGRVEGSSHLRERMARNSGGELVYYEDRRWTERPEIYLRRALARTLFEERGVVEALSGRAVTLEVELIAFEEIVQPHVARIQARVMLRSDGIGLLDETVTIEQPVAEGGKADPARAMVDALSQALNAGVTRIADHVIAKLADADQAQHAEQ